MRTTITLDDDVAVAELGRSRNRSLREVINTLLRIGLSRIDGPVQPGPEVRARVVSLGGSRLPNVDDITEVLAIAEGEGQR